MKLIDALRISYSYPVVFNKVEYNNKIYIDGCVTNNFPIEYFKDYPKESTMGILIHSEKTSNKGFFQYIHSVFSLPIRKNEVFKIQQDKDQILILDVFLEDLSKINHSDIINMICIGEKQMELFLKKKAIRYKQKQMEQKLLENIESMKKKKNLEEIISMDSEFSIGSFSDLNDEIMDLLNQIS